MTDMDRGQTELDQFQKGKTIDDYVGTWQVPFSDGTAILGHGPVTLTKKDETTLVASGLSALGVADDIVLQYNASNGLLTFTAQDVAPMGQYEDVFAAPVNYNTGYLTDDPNEKFIGGLKKDGSFSFINDEANESAWNAICFFANTPNGIGRLSDYAELVWTPLETETKAASSLRSSNGLRQIGVKIGNSPRRSFSTDLQIEPQPIKGLQVRKAIAQPDHNLMFTH